jgi:hypothetical protein
VTTRCSAQCAGSTCARDKPESCGYRRHRLPAYSRRRDAAKRPLGQSPHSDLGIVVAHLAARIAGTTGEDWRKDAFSFEALKAAIEFVFSQLQPDGEIKIPAAIKQFATGPKSDQSEQMSSATGSHHWQKSRSEQMSRPDGVGLMVGWGFWDQLLLSKEEPLARKHEYYADEFYVLPRVRRNLNLKP